MTYLPASIYTVTDIRTVRTAAIGKTADDRGITYLITGGRDPMVVYLTGDRAGRGYSMKNAGSEPFLAVFDVEFEVDPSSAYRPAYVEQPAGALLLSDKSTGINVLTGGGEGFDHLTEVYLDDPLDGSKVPGVGRFGFTRWRAVKRVGSEVHEIVSFEATRKADL